MGGLLVWEVVVLVGVERGEDKKNPPQKKKEGGGREGGRQALISGSWNAGSK